MSEPEELSEYGQPVVRAHLDRVVIDTPPQPLSEEVVRDMGKATVNFENFSLPWDWQNPDFSSDECTRAHQWKRYATDEVAALWPTFSDAQKQAISRMLEEIAGLEDWD